MRQIKSRSIKEPHIDGLAKNQLLEWYKKNHRRLPWRENRDPYRIWISETMLQQTTTTAVLGFYERFLKRFPTLADLASASIENIYEMWAGLGYYSRARNLHKAAQMLSELGSFPETYSELLKYPGFGPYTSRAVSSLAFSEAVGVVDGNVIRVFSRKENWPLQWWQTTDRSELQTHVDQFVAGGPSHELNQALMELGSQICLPKNPHCLICPWMTFCQSFHLKTIGQLPLARPRRKHEVWVWSPTIKIKNKRILLEKNLYAPFLRGAWILPGQAKQRKSRPQRYDFRHSITHHEIFVQLADKKIKMKHNNMKLNKNKPEQIWVKLSDLSQYAPASLMRKTVDYVVYKK